MSVVVPFFVFKCLVIGSCVKAFIKDRGVCSISDVFILLLY